MLNKTMIATIFSLLPLLTNNPALANPLVISPQPVHVNTPLPFPITIDDINKSINLNPLPQIDDINKLIKNLEIDTSKIQPINLSTTQPDYNYVQPIYNYVQPIYDYTQSTTSQPIDNNINISCWKEKFKVIEDKIVCDNE